MRAAGGRRAAGDIVTSRATDDAGAHNAAREQWIVPARGGGRAAGAARLALRRFFRHRPALVGLTLLALLIFAALCAPLIAPHDPLTLDPCCSRAGPSRAHPLGTDRIGRDVLSRLVYGARVSLAVGTIAVALYVAIGTTLGAVAGCNRGWPDALIMRLTDMVLAIPGLVIIIALVAVLGPSIRNIILIIGLLQWPATARLVRGQCLSLREAAYVEAARALGAPGRRIVIRHILPGALPLVGVSAAFGVAGAILLESGLSFLGVGVRPPAPSWGNMLADAQSLTILESMPWLWLPPGLMITLAVLAFTFIGDGLRDALDPRSGMGATQRPRKHRAAEAGEPLRSAGTDESRTA
jgi:peptide/nickel transport system permease protein